MILKDLDLAELRGYEQAKELTIDLLKKWLVKYKFKNWIVHKSNPDKIGQIVTDSEKQDRAANIAEKLSDNNTWKSHSRPINIEALENELKLKIDNYSNIIKRRDAIRSYYFLLTDYIHKNNIEYFLYTRRFI